MKARHILLAIITVLLGVPIAAFVVANAIGSDTLAFLAGLSLMVVFSFVPVIGLALLVWWLVWGRRRSSAPTATARASPPRPAADTLTAPSPPVTTEYERQWLNRKRGMLLMAGGILSSFWVMMGIGFWLDDRYEAPAIVTMLFPLALVVLIVALAAGARYVWTHRDEFTPRFSSIGSVSLWPSKDLARQRQWIASMAADPRRRRYADLIAAGDSFWTPERVEYDLDPHATTTCAHLRPVESAMREEGVEVRLSWPRTVSATCLVDQVALGKRFVLPEGTGYRELQTFDRGGEELSALVTCDACNSSIWVVHPRDAAAGIAVFPRESRSPAS